MSNKREAVLKDFAADSPRSILYVMSRDQRVADNHALIAAQSEAVVAKLPLVVCFSLYAGVGVRSREHYEFMTNGLKEIANRLAGLNIPFVIRIGPVVEVVKKISKEVSPKSIYFDFNPLRGPQAVQKKIAEQVNARCVVVDTHNIIPLWVLSDKEEFAAHTIRRKVQKHLADWLVEPEEVHRHMYEMDINIDSASWPEVEAHVAKITASGIKPLYPPGEKAAHSELEKFIQNGLGPYASERNIPTVDGQSNLSPYLHFGHISALRVALELRREADDTPLLLREARLAGYEGEPTKQDSINALLEELIVRKELADNYCFYNSSYDNLEGARDWAKHTLTAHQQDAREYTYTRDEWEKAETHDDAWNSAQVEMMHTGKMHGYMRMYWAKKILEWSKSPSEAIRIAVYLNDHYSIDGGDPNGYTGIMWSIAGVHDRPWFDREVYGKVRYMNAGGLKRKFKLDEYIDRWRKANLN